MVLRVVQRGEVVPVGLDLGTVGDVEADRAEDRLDPLPGADDRVDAAAAAAAAGQRDVERLLGEPRSSLRARQLGAPALERLLDALLGGVDAPAGGLAFLRARACRGPSAARSAPRPCRGSAPWRSRATPGRRPRRTPPPRARRWLSRPSSACPVPPIRARGRGQWARLALTWPAILANAGLSAPRGRRAPCGRSRSWPSSARP